MLITQMNRPHEDYLHVIFFLSELSNLMTGYLWGK